MLKISTNFYKFPGSPNQGCLNGCPTVKITVRMSADVIRTSTRVRIYPEDAVLPTDGFFTIRGCGKNCIRVDP
jgi:hypothetical protein